MRRNAEDEANSHLPLSIKCLDHQTLFLSKEGVWEKLKFLAGVTVADHFYNALVQNEQSYGIDFTTV